jgi:predicted peroxiredoxin
MDAEATLAKPSFWVVWCQETRHRSGSAIGDSKACFPFDHGIILAEAGHAVQIFLIAEAVSLFRRATAEAVVPVGWPPLCGVMEKAVAGGIQLYACHACSNARGITEADLAPYKAKWGGPEVLVELVEWADKIMTL